MQKIKNILSYLWNTPRRYKIIAAAIVALVLLGLRFFGGGSTAETALQHRHVTVASAASLSDPAGPLPVTGKVTSVSKANLLAGNSGEIVTLSRKLGDRVAAGAIIASFENASQRAAVLQAQGAYDAAVAAKTSVSPVDAQTSAVNTYTSTYNSLDILLRTQVDTFFGGPTPYGPDLLISAPNFDVGELSRERALIREHMLVYQQKLADAPRTNPATLLSEASTMVQEVATFLTRLATAANRRDSRATDEQLAALAAARSSIGTITSAVATAQQNYRSQSVTTTTTTDANVTIALGGLRAAQASLEKTIVRAPISGTIVSLPINKGDYISAGTLVAAISNPGALQIETYVTSDDAKTLAAGGKAVIEGSIPGTIVFVAPAIDPSIGKIQVKVGLGSNRGDLTDGDTVALTLSRAGSKTQALQKQLMIPISAAKITPTGPVVFTVENGALVANPIVFGDVVGGRVEVVSGLTSDMVIVTDARGLSAGQTVVTDTN